MAVMSSCGFHYHISNSCVVKVMKRKDTRETYHVITHGHKQIEKAATRLESVSSTSRKGGGGFVQLAASFHLHLHRPTSLEGRSTSDD